MKQKKYCLNGVMLRMSQVRMFLLSIINYYVSLIRNIFSSRSILTIITRRILVKIPMESTELTKKKVYSAFKNQNNCKKCFFKYAIETKIAAQIVFINLSKIYNCNK